MSDTLLFTNLAVAIAAIVVMIVVLRIEAVIALLVGSLYFGLVTGLGTTGTLDAIATGFGDVLGEVGLLIAFGVLIGRLLATMGVLERLADGLLRIVGPKHAAYTFGATLNIGFSAIVPDVLLVIVAPLGRSLSRTIGRNGTPMVSAALTAAMYVSVGMMVPGVGALALAGVLQIPLATMFLYGYLIGVPTVALTFFAMNRLLAIPGFWNAEKDEESDAPVDEAASHPAESTAAGGTVAVVTAKRVPVLVAVSPVLLALALIFAASLADAFDAEIAGLAFLGNPLIALFIALVLTSILKSVSSSRDETASVTKSALQQTGQILVLTGIGGSLAEVINQSGMKDALGHMFSSSVVSPLVALMLAWFVAAVLHLSIGSVLVSGLTAAGILAPVMGLIDVDPVLIALAAGAGSIFCAHVSSNVFWMFRSLLGLSVRGTFKAHTLVMSLASVIALGLIMALSLVS